MNAVIKGWRIRSIINSLATEIQDYVNCDAPVER